MLKTDGIPTWVTVFALIAFLMGCASGLAGVFSQGMEGINESMSISWGGRSIGLGLAAGLAVYLKHPTAYIVAFIGGMGRDLGDLAGELSKQDPAKGIVLFLVVFLILETLGIIAAQKARSLPA